MNTHGSRPVGFQTFRGLYCEAMKTYQGHLFSFTVFIKNPTKWAHEGHYKVK